MFALLHRNTINNAFHLPFISYLAYTGTNLSPNIHLTYCDTCGPLRYDGVARAVGVAEVWVKDETDRLGCGSFKVRAKL
jgi:hypothetical protein